MPIGVVSDEDFQSEVDSFNGGNGNSSIVNIQRGRGHVNQVPDSLRKIIGENAVEEGSKETKNLTHALGISDSSLEAYKHGANSCATYNEPSLELKDHVDNARKRITKMARNRLVKSLKHITDEKLAEEKPRDLAGIAKDMSAIIKNIEPESTQVNNSPTFVFYAPRIVTEDRFDVITVQE